MPKNKEIKLGYQVKDIVSGFTGIVTSKTEYLNGCVRLCVSPKVKKDGTLPLDQFFDVQQLSVVKETTPESSVVAAKTGGSRPSPRNVSNPK